MSENDLDDDRPLGPCPVDLVPGSVVDRLVAQNHADLEALRAELASARREAELAEETLRQAHPASLVYDSDFAAEVLRYVTQCVGPSVPPPNPAPVSYSTTPNFDEVQRVLTDAGSQPTVDAPAPARSGNGADPSGAHPASRDDSAGADGVAGASAVGPVEPPAQGDQRLAATSRPRTTVVERDRPVPSDAAAPPSWERPTGELPAEDVPSVEDSRPEESAPLSDDASSDRWDREPIGQSTLGAPRHWSKRVPSRLLIQLGLLIVIVGLIVLKLG